ncbi:Fc.00g111530.m01.CDS01 [Cosmosporella sp. VM-42]
MTIFRRLDQIIHIIIVLLSGQSPGCCVRFRETSKAAIGATGNDENDKHTGGDLESLFVVDDGLFTNTKQPRNVALKGMSKREKKAERKLQKAQREHAKAKPPKPNHSNNRNQKAAKPRKQGIRLTTKLTPYVEPGDPRPSKGQRDKHKIGAKGLGNWDGECLNITTKPFPGSILMMPRDLAWVYARQACRISSDEFLILWTDGSLLRDGRAGASVVYEDPQVKDHKNKPTWQAKIWRVTGHEESIGGIEQFAIAAALELATKKIKGQKALQINSVTVFSDCCNAIEASCIRRPWCPPTLRPLQALVQQRAEELVSLGVELCVAWAPGRDGIEGNVRAHHAAQAAAHVTADAHEGTLALPQTLDDIKELKLCSTLHTENQIEIPERPRVSIEDPSQSILDEKSHLESNGSLKPTKGTSSRFSDPAKTTSTHPPKPSQNSPTFELPAELRLPEVGDFGVELMSQELLNIMDETMRGEA